MENAQMRMQLDHLDRQVKDRERRLKERDQQLADRDRLLAKLMELKPPDVRPPQPEAATVIRDEAAVRRDEAFVGNQCGQSVAQELRETPSVDSLTCSSTLQTQATSFVCIGPPHEQAADEQPSRAAGSEGSTPMPPVPNHGHGLGVSSPSASSGRDLAGLWRQAQSASPSTNRTPSTGVAPAQSGGSGRQGVRDWMAGLVVSRICSGTTCSGASSSGSDALTGGASTSEWSPPVPNREATEASGPPSTVTNDNCRVESGAEGQAGAMRWHWHWKGASKVFASKDEKNSRKHLPTPARATNSNAAMEDNNSRKHLPTPARANNNSAATVVATNATTPVQEGDATSEQADSATSDRMAPGAEGLLSPPRSTQPTDQNLYGTGHGLTPEGFGGICDASGPMPRHPEALLAPLPETATATCPPVVNKRSVNGEKKEHEEVVPALALAPLRSACTSASPTVGRSKHTRDRQRSHSGSSHRNRSPREYIVEVITPQQAQELTHGAAGSLLSPLDSPKTPLSPALLLCPGSEYAEFDEGPSIVPRSDSSISVSSDEGDIKDRLRQVLKIETSSIGTGGGGGPAVTPKSPPAVSSCCTSNTPTPTVATAAANAPANAWIPHNVPPMPQFSGGSSGKSPAPVAQQSPAQPQSIPSVPQPPPRQGGLTQGPQYSPEPAAGKVHGTNYSPRSVYAGTQPWLAHTAATASTTAASRMPGVLGHRDLLPGPAVAAPTQAQVQAQEISRTSRPDRTTPQGNPHCYGPAPSYSCSPRLHYSGLTQSSSICRQPYAPVVSRVALGTRHGVR